MNGAGPGGPLVLVGAGGHGRELLDIVEAINASVARWQILGFVSDHAVDDAAIGRRGLAVLGPVSLLDELEASYVLAIGDGRVRRSVEACIDGATHRPVTLVHPAGTVAPSADPGEGLVVAAGASVGADARLGRHVHLNANATVAAGAEVGDYVTVSPGALVSGDATVGKGAFIGIGASVLEGAVVAPEAMVGAGAVVQGPMPPSRPLVGNPAHPTR